MGFFKFLNTAKANPEHIVPPPVAAMDPPPMSSPGLELQQEEHSDIPSPPVQHTSDDVGLSSEIDDFPAPPNLDDSGLPKIKSTEYDTAMNIPLPPINAVDIPKDHFQEPHEPAQSHHEPIPHESKAPIHHDLPVKPIPTEKKTPDFPDFNAPSKHEEPELHKAPDEQIIDSPEVELNTEEETEFFEREIDSQRPIFLPINKYERVLVEIEGINDDIKSGEDVLASFERIRVNCDEHFETWRKKIEYLHKKFSNIDSVLFRKGG